MTDGFLSIPPMLMTKAVENDQREAGGRSRISQPGDATAPGGPAPLLALQRSAGNAAVAALLSGKKKATEETRLGDIDHALKEIKKSNPHIDTVEKGLMATRDAGVPVDLDGEDQKPPASALDVAKVGFDPAAVPAKQPVPPPKPAPPASPLAKVSKVPPKPKGKGKAGTGSRSKAGPQEGSQGGGGGTPSAGVVDDDTTVTGEAGLQPPVRPTFATPEDDPGFTAVAGAIGAYAKGKKAHPPAAAEAKEAQGAAVAPANDVDSQAKAAKLDTMAAQQPGTFDKKAFIAAVKSAIEARSPKTLKEADEYEKSGKAGEVKGEVQALVGTGKDESQKDIEAATDAPPDPSTAVPKPVCPMGADDPGEPSTLDPAAAVPKPAPPEQTSLAYGKHEVATEMRDEEVTERQLAQSNETEFTDALAAKKEAAAHADAAPREFRQHESAKLEQSKQEADAVTAEGMAGMHGSKTASLRTALAAKGATKSKDEEKRAAVTAKVQSIYAATEADVRKILGALDPKVERAFEVGEQAARAAFERLVAAKMSAYKKDRYGGWLGGLRWAKDKLLGMPSKVNEFFEAGRQLYLSKMNAVISNVADIVGNDLAAAKARIAQGRQEIADYVKSLPTDLQKVGQEAADEIGEQFAQLESDVDAKQESLVDSLATKYVEARQGLDERIEQLQDENKGLVDKAVGAIKKVVAVIKQLKDLFLGVLAKAASAFKAILAAPVAFITNFMSAVKQGFMNFAANIWAHLKKGLLGWLFGALASAGITLPTSFDLKGVLKLVVSLLGLTWAAIRTRLLKLVPPRVLEFLETKVEVFIILVREGPAGLWKWIVDKVGDLKEKILSPIKEFVVEKIIKAGITWVIGMLNPAGALIKIVQALVSVVRWIMERGAQLVDFVNTIIGAVVQIAKGGAGGVSARIEGALAKALPLVISFLASLLGLGGISEKVKSVIQAVQKPVSQAIDAVIKRALKAARGLIAKAKGIGGKARATVLGGDDTTEGKQQRLDKGVAAGTAAANRFAGKPVVAKVLKPLLGAIRRRYGLATLEPVPQGEHWAIRGRVNPEKTQVSQAKKSTVDPAKVKAAIATATAERGKAVAEHQSIESQMLARGTKSAREEARRITVACGGGAVRRQGGGSLQEAKKATPAAFRHKEAEDARREAIAQAQKDAYLHDPTLTADGLGEMMRSHAFLADVRKRMEAKGVYTPQGRYTDRGQPGSTAAVHAEKLVHRAAGAVPIGVSRQMCPDCQRFFESAAANGTFLVVADPDVVRIFLPDGTVLSPSDFP